MMKSTALGRSWNFEYLKLTTTGAAIAVPQKFSIHFKKDIDPLSGMTVNLTEIDEWWAKTSFIRQKKWLNPSDFLNAVKTLLLPLWQQQQIQDWEISITDQNRHSYLLTQKGLTFKTPLEYSEARGDKLKSRRIALIASSEELPAGLLQKIQIQISENTIDQWPGLLKSVDSVKKIEVLNFYNSDIEYEIKI